MWGNIHQKKAMISPNTASLVRIETVRSFRFRFLKILTNGEARIARKLAIFCNWKTANKQIWIAKFVRFDPLTEHLVHIFARWPKVN